MRKIIFDCDNTFGLIDRDVDDGLTLLYLLGAPHVELLGVTLTYGNGSIEEVNKMTKEMKEQLGLSFDFFSGSKQNNLAAAFLVEQVNRFPNEVTIVATGALTNLAEAQKIDSDFFAKVQEVVLMGGTTEPLIVNQQAVSELNFSCDPDATRKVLLSQATITIMNGHMTAAAFFSKNDLKHFFERAAGMLKKESMTWLKDTLKNWIIWNERVFHFSGFCNWDMTTAVYLEAPELFSDEHYFLSENQPNLSKGQMTLVKNSKYVVKMPKTLLDVQLFNELAIEGMIAGLRYQ